MWCDPVDPFDPVSTVPVRFAVTAVTRVRNCNFVISFKAKKFARDAFLCKCNMT